MEYRDQVVWVTTFLTDHIPYTHLKLWRAYTSTYSLVRIGRVHTYSVAHNTSFQAGPYNNNPALFMSFHNVSSIICIPLLEVVHVGVNKINKHAFFYIADSSRLLKQEHDKVCNRYTPYFLFKGLQFNL